MRFALLFGAGTILMWLWVRKIPKPGSYVSEQWLKDHRTAEGLDFDPEPAPALRLIRSEAQSAPGAYSKPVGER